jgi:hypothetical protein
MPLCPSSFYTWSCPPPLNWGTAGTTDANPLTDKAVEPPLPHHAACPSAGSVTSILHHHHPPSSSSLPAGVSPSVWQRGIWSGRDCMLPVVCVTDAGDGFEIISPILLKNKTMTSKWPDIIHFPMCWLGYIFLSISVRLQRVVIAKGSLANW